MGDLNIQNLYPKTKTVGIKITELYSLETQIVSSLSDPFEGFWYYKPKVSSYPAGPMNESLHPYKSDIEK